MRLLVLWLLCILCFPTAVSAQSLHRRVALLVAVSDYAQGTDPGDRFHRLNTLPDLDRMEALLRTQGFTRIVTLRNSQATQANILENIRDVLLQPFKDVPARPGDHVTFYFSGHGHQVRHALYAEPGESASPDGWDECLVCWTPAGLRSDIRARHKAMYLRDKTLGRAFRSLAGAMQLRSGNGGVTVILDACHSGTGIRGLLSPKGRPYDPQIDGDSGDSPAPDAEVASLSVAKASAWETVMATSAASSPDEAGVILLAAARSDQNAYNAGVGSLFTQYLDEAVRALRRRNPTPQSVIEWAGAQARQAQIDQTPQCEANNQAAGSPLFGDWKVSAAGAITGNYEVVEGVQTAPHGSLNAPGIPQCVVLSIGRFLGATAGSKFALYLPGTTDTPSNKLADVQVRDVRPFECLADVMRTVRPDKTPADYIGARAVETSHVYEGEPLRLFIEDRIGGVASEPSAAEFRAQVARLNFASVTTDAVQAEAILRRELDAHGNATWRRYLPTGRAKVLGTSPTVETLRGELIGLWRWKRLHTIAAQTKPLLDLRIVTLPDGASEVETLPENVVDGGFAQVSGKLAGGVAQVRLQPGMRICGVARKLRPNMPGEPPLFLNLVYLQSDGAISLPIQRGPDGKTSDWVTKPDLLEDGRWHLLFTSPVPIPAVTQTENETMLLIAVPNAQLDLSLLETRSGERGEKGKSADTWAKLLFALQDGEAGSLTKELGDIAGLTNWTFTRLEIEMRPN